MTSGVVAVIVWEQVMPTVAGALWRIGKNHMHSLFMPPIDSHCFLMPSRAII